MFKEARIQLTAWYLAIIMAISLSFSVVIYIGINRELVRYDVAQRLRQDRVNQITLFLKANGLPVPPDVQNLENESIEAIRLRIISVLGLINLGILVLSGAGGYFLAGRTLEPIQKNMEDQKAFVSDASHELRTPLTSLKTEIEVALRDKNLSLADARSLLKSNLEDVDKMQKLSNYLLKMNRYEEGQNLTIEKVDLKEVALVAIGKQKVKTDLTKSIVAGNFDSLVELVTILLDNAKKYGDGKEVLVRTSGRTLSVIDHGVGITKEDLPHIFDRFYRSDKSRGTDGYGLGLSIAKSIAESNGARIKATSKPGNGSAFSIVF